MNVELLRRSDYEEMSVVYLVARKGDKLAYKPLFLEPKQKQQLSDALEELEGVYKNL